MSFADIRDFVQQDDDTLPIGYRDEYLKPDWTLVQTFAWAVHRSAAWARRLAPFYLHEKPPTPLCNVGMSEARKLMIWERWPGKVSLPEEADAQLAFIAPWHDLWDALAAGTLKATGIPADGSERVTIPDIFWQDVNQSEWHGGPKDAVSICDRLGSIRVRYTTVRVRRYEVVRLWPSSTPEAGSSPTSAHSDFVKSSRRRGPKASVRPRVEQEMQGDLASGKFTVAQLDAMTHAALGAEYRASETTVSEIRDRIVLSKRITGNS